jgi:hypothetical protein
MVESYIMALKEYWRELGDRLWEIVDRGEPPVTGNDFDCE